MDYFNKENFSGNVYLLIPCSLKDKKDTDSLVNMNVSDDENFIDLLSKQSEIEVQSLVHNTLVRGFLGKLKFSLLDKKESSERASVMGGVYYTLHPTTGLVVIMICFLAIEAPVSQILDQMSQNCLEILTDDGNILFSKYLNNKNIRQVSKGKACLSAANSNNDFFCSYMANETYDSEVMSAKLNYDIFGKENIKNIAQYDSSDLYASKNSVVRIDKRSYTRKDKITRLGSDVIFLFIMEILVLKEAAIERSRGDVQNYIAVDQKISYKKLSRLVGEFGQTMPFWNIEIFNYITAQNLANELEQSFEIQKKHDNFIKNQEFLQYKISLKQTINQERENIILFLIAMIVFIFELFDFLSNFIDKKISIGISFSTTMLLYVIIANVLKRKK